MRSILKTAAIGVTAALLVLGAQSRTDRLVEKAERAYQAGKHDRAVKRLQRALKRDPEAPAAHRLLAIISSERGDWDSAAEHFQAVLESRPGDSGAYYELGKVHQSREDWKAAAQSFAKALLHQHPDREKVTLALASSQVRAGHFQQALTALQSLPEPADSQLAVAYHSTEAQALVALDRPSEALSALQRALQTDTRNPKLWALHIDTLLATGQQDRAWETALRAQRFFVDNPDIQYRFGVASYEAGNPFVELALRNLREADPSDSRIGILEALIAGRRGENEKARQLLQSAAEKGVKDAERYLGALSSAP